MTPERHALIREIFLAVVSSSPDKRAAVLDQRCGDDHELRREVERLMAHHEEGTITPDSQGARSPIAGWRQAGLQLDPGANGTPGLPRAAPFRSAVDAGRELGPGTVVASRYCIVSPLGGGGMGVVYRAEDLTLRQPVALKFLSPSLAGNPAWLARFCNEARMAREVTHPCVCRMYDIGEVEGQHFLSMEYVDGEDLDSLIRRIGRLPCDKAVYVARQVCIGLAAAHGAGILHRDLKPANIMLDGRGQVRITDFGLAALPEQITAGEIRAGTPAYMAPEQISGREVTIQSDIYSLGLVLYEILAGRPAFQAGSIQEYRELHEKSTPTPLSELVQDLPPDVERVVARCLEKNPQDRPRSALEVAAALPGGNLLAAALAANLTPTPEMVAAATPMVARTSTPVVVLLVALASLAALVVVRTIAPASWVPVGKTPPAVLAEEARKVIEAAGHPSEGGYSAYGFCRASDSQLLGHGYRLPEDMVHPAVGPADELVFWYRRSPERLVPSEVENVMLWSARVTPGDPAPGTPGAASVVLDVSGRLLLFAAVPELATPTRERGGTVEREQWDAFLKRAGVDPAALVAAEPGARSLYQANEQLAWRAPHQAGGRRPIWVEAISSGGRPLLFAVGQSAGDGAATWHSESLQARGAVATGSLRIVLLLITVVAIPSAWLNYRAGRSDLTGAVRLAIFVVVIQFSAWLLRARHVSDLNAELLNICLASLQAVGIAALLGVFYVALEPVARRYWPDMLITWSRALSLRLRDPLLGQHVAAGVCTGCFWALIVASERGLVDWMGWDVRHSLLTEVMANNLLGGRVALAGCSGALTYALFRGLLFVLLLAVLRSLVRRPLPAAVIAGLIVAPMVVPSGAHVYTSWLAFGLCGVALGVWVMIRYGLVTLSVALYVAVLLNTSPITFDLHAWYADQSMYVLGIVAALAIYGFITVRSGRVAR